MVPPKFGDLCFAFVLIIYSVLNPAKAILQKEELPDEARLKTDLLRHYDHSVRPVSNTSQSTRIVADVALQQIIDVNEKLQILRGTFWMRLYWTDTFLTWNASDYGGITNLKFEPKQLWLPDICLYDALSPAIHANEMQDFFISVWNDGSIMWLSPIVAENVCYYNVRFFPYDTQRCTMTVGSWLYHGLEVDLWNRGDTGDMKDFKQNVEWEITGFPAERVVTTYNCCPEPYPVLEYTLILKRRPGYYVTYLYMPSVVIICASLFAFYLPPGSDAKVDLAVTGLLSQTVFLLLISDLMPPDAHNPPLLGKCLSILLIVQAAAVVVNVIIKRIHDDSYHKTKPPGKLLLKVLHYLKYPFFLPHIDYKGIMTDQSSDSSPSDDIKCKPLPSLTEKANLSNGSLNDEKQMEGCETNIAYIIDLEDEIMNGINHVNIDKKPPKKVSSNNGRKSAASTRQCSHPSVENVEKALSEILQEMKHESSKRSMDLVQESITNQWKHVAAMYDRIALVLFVIVILGITIWFVTITPMNSESE